jgi:hypothetical protein
VALQLRVVGPLEANRTVAVQRLIDDVWVGRVTDCADRMVARSGRARDCPTGSRT